MAALSRALRWVSKTRPVLLDVAGLAFIAYGIWLLETARPGIWSIAVGVGLILAGLRSQS